MLDRKVKIIFNGRTGKIMDIKTGVPQESATSPILFSIFIAVVFKKAEKDAPELTMTSFLDDETWVMDGTNITQCTSEVQRSARGATK
jgi:hypothetical protein